MPRPPRHSYVADAVEDFATARALKPADAAIAAALEAARARLRKARAFAAAPPAGVGRGSGGPAKFVPMFRVAYSGSSTPCRTMG